MVNLSLKNRFMQALTSLIVFLVWSLFALWSMSGEFEIESSLVISSIVSIGVWINLKVGFLRGVRIKNGVIEVRNYISGERFDGDLVKEVRVVGGVLLIELKDGCHVRPSAFEVSLMTSFLGSPEAKRAKLVIESSIQIDKRRPAGGSGEIKRFLCFDVYLIPIVFSSVFLSYYLINLALYGY